MSKRNMRHNNSIISLLAVLSVALLMNADAGEILVTPSGISPAAALAKIRAAKAAGDKSAWTVQVKKGLYTLDKPLVFTPGDSGSPEAKVRWVGEDGAILSGGQAIDGWRESAEKGVWEADAPKGADGKAIWFESLYVNDRRADRSRLPRGSKLDVNAYFHSVDWYQLTETNKANEVEYTEHVRFIDPKHELKGLTMEELADAKLCAVVKWAYCTYKFEGFDTPETEHYFKELKDPLWSPWPARIPENLEDMSAVFRFRGRDRVRYWKAWDGECCLFSFENLRRGFTEPGQWYYNRKAAKLYYRPRTGETLSAMTAFAPVSGLVTLVRFDGKPEKSEYVHDIEFENLAFIGTRPDGDRLENGMVQQYLLQAANRAGGAIAADGAHRIRLERCRVAHTGNYAIWFERGCVSNQFVSCSFDDLGAGGIWLGDRRGNLKPKALQGVERYDPYADWPNCYNKNYHPLPGIAVDTYTPESTAFNLVDDCDIKNCGNENPEGVGVVFTHVSDSTLTHCDIGDLWYSGVSVGWVWGYTGSVAQRNTIAFNHIHDLGKGIMSDMGGIYTLGTSFGTCISNNTIHAIDSYSYGGWGLYNDEGSEGVVWENNLVYDTKSASYHQHYGRGNLLRNNILANSRETQITVSQAEPHLSASFEHNVVYWDDPKQKYPGVKYFTERRPFVKEGTLRFVDNIFWCAGGPTRFGCEPNAANPGREQMLPLYYPGVVCDPGFRDPKKGDFTLKADSPLVSLGFKPWDYSAVGRRKR